MIRRYTHSDIEKAKAVFATQPDLHALMSTYIEVTDMLYFDLWVSDSFDVCIFRSYGSFYMIVEKTADIDELVYFLSFMPMIDKITCSAPCMEEIAIKMQGVRGTTERYTTKLTRPEMLEGYELNVSRASTATDYRAIFNLFKEEKISGLPEFDDYYFARRAIEKASLGRTLSLIHNEEIFATVSTAAETVDTALISDVVTAGKYRRQGLATALMSHLCKELISEGKTPYVTYTTSQAGKLYEGLGFEVTGKSTIINFINS